MKRFILAVLLLSVSSYLYADIVPAISVATNKSPVPKYFSVCEETKLYIDDNSLSICSTNVSIEFPMEDNPQITFTSIDNRLIEGSVGIDNVIIESTGSQIFTLDGTEIDKGNITSGTYIVRSNNQSYKIIIK